MVKLNLRFHWKLDSSSFAPGAGTYLLHAMVVHSGDVHSGQYAANLQNARYKFDDECVRACSEYAIVEDTHGGNDLMLWNHKEHTPRDLHHMSTPRRDSQCVHACPHSSALCIKVLKAPDPTLKSKNDGPV